MTNTNVTNISAIYDPLTVEKDGDRIADELIQEFKEEQETTGKPNFFATEGKARLKMIEGFAKDGLKDKELDELITKYLIMAMTPATEGYDEKIEHELLDLIIAKMDALLIKQAKKQTKVRRIRKRSAIEKMPAGKIKRLIKKQAKKEV